MVKLSIGPCIDYVRNVHLGDRIKKGDVIAYGSATTADGELALGRNVLVAYMPWHGFNYEDSVVISERLVKSDAFTSMSISEHSITCGRTKQGEQIITRDVPNITEKALKDLDKSGIIKVGSEVKPGSILVGRVTPQATNPSDTDKIMTAIFNNYSNDKDDSLYASANTYGRVIGVQVFPNSNKSKREEQIETDQTNAVKRRNGRRA